ncbi:MAG: translation initiation factor IF-2 [Alphaproteobacteria bacterium]
MTEANDSGKNSLKLSRPGRLELKKTVEAGQVRQSFSHGRSKAVAVEVKKKRTFTRGEKQGEMAESAPLEPAGQGAAAIEASRPDFSNLSEAERAARQRALEARREQEIREAELAAQREAEEKARKETEALEAQATAQDRAQDQARERTDLEARALADQEVRGKITVVSPAPPRPVTAKPLPGKAGEEEAEAEADDTRPKRGRVEVKKPVAAKRVEPRRKAGKLTINQALQEGEGIERMRSLAAVRRAREREKQKLREQMQPQERKKFARDVVVPEVITVQELANRMAEKGADVVKALMKMGVMATITQAIDADTAELVVTEFGHKIRRVSEADVEIGLSGATDEEGAQVPRPPVVTIMGHVDHGKTSLLDAIRKTDVAAHEAGGITQHIGAYQVTLPSGGKMTFLDTPGHEAFTAMRARGAKVTDIVILVVAADDGIQPQTIEAIAHTKAAKVPMIVAINKCDKPDANPQRVRQELLQHEIVTEELGGDVLAVEVSAKTGMNLDKLEEAILLQAEVLELKANPNRLAQGTVIEAKLERGRGAVATVLVQKGTLRPGDIFVAGPEFGRVRALLDDKNKSIDAATPAMPVEVLGLNGTPSAGDDFAVVESEARAREITEYRQRVIKRDAVVARGTVEQMFTKIASGSAKELPIVVKADVQGSIEAIIGAVQKISTDEVAVRVLHSGVGGINESDVALAKASGGIVIGFNVRANQQARDLSTRDKIDIRYYSIIYDITDDIKALLSGMLAPTVRENFIGNAEIRQVFKITKSGMVAGCMVTSGVVKRGAGVRLLRDNVVVHEGKLSTLKRFKDEVREVREGFECGMAFENYQDIKVGDIIECFEVESVQRTLA